VVPVEDDLRLRVFEVLAGRADVGVPHVHRHRRDPGALLGAEVLEKPVQAGLTPFVGQVLDGAGLEVGHDGDVALAPAGRLLVHPDQRRDDVGLSRQAPGDGPVHQVPRFVPAEAKQPGGPLDVALFEHVDGQALEQHGEPAHRLGPGEGDLTHAMGRALDARRAGMQVGQERAAVEMAPDPLLGVVVDGQLGAALRTREPGALGMLGPHVNPAAVDRQLDAAHLPGRDESQQVAVELGVTHHAIVADTVHVDLANVSSTHSPTENPEEPKPGIVAVVLPDGTSRQVADDLWFPNGMAVLGDYTLAIAESHADRLSAWTITDSGELVDRRVWANLGPGAAPDRICADPDEAIWYTSVPNKCRSRVALGGRVLETVEVDRSCLACTSACILGGDKGGPCTSWQTITATAARRTVLRCYGSSGRHAAQRAPLREPVSALNPSPSALEG